MKHIVIYLFAFLSAVAFSACEQEMEVYNAPGNDRLNFVYEDMADSVLSYTFIYCPAEQMRDTIWLEVATVGYVTDEPRPVALRQVMTGQDDAVAGKHYVAFNDETLKDTYVIPAHANTAKLPLIVKKDDPALEEKEFILRFRVEENGYFKSGFPETRERVVYISNILTRPKNWTEYATYYFAGAYGKVKHRFMIDVCAEKGITVDEKFFKDLVGDVYNVDMGLTGYWNDFFNAALKEENARRAEQNLGPLREAPAAGETEGKLVEFLLYDRSDF